MSGRKVSYPRDMRSTDSNALGCAPLEDQFNPLLDDFEPKSRPYKHFDLPLSEEARQKFSLSPNDISRHAFWPLLGFVKKQRRIKPQAPSGIKIKIKDRDIRFASHSDAAILEYYAQYLGNKTVAPLSQWISAAFSTTSIILI